MKFNIKILAHSTTIGKATQQRTTKETKKQTEKRRRNKKNELEETTPFYERTTSPKKKEEKLIQKKGRTVTIEKLYKIQCYRRNFNCSHLSVELAATI